MNINLISNGTTENISDVFLDLELVKALKEITSFVRLCEYEYDSTGILSNVYLSISEINNDIKTVYSIELGFEIPNWYENVNDPYSQIRGCIKREDCRFSDIVTALTTISANIQAIEALATKKMTKEECGVLVLRNFSYYLEANILLCREWDVCVLVMTMRDMDDKEYRENMPEWIDKYFNISSTGFNTCMSEEEEEKEKAKKMQYKERFLKFLFNEKLCWN